MVDYIAVSLITVTPHYIGTHNKDMESMKKKIERYLNHEASGNDLLLIRRWFENDAALGEWFREGIERSDTRIDSEVDARLRARLAGVMVEEECADSESGSGIRRMSGFRNFFDIAAVVAMIVAISTVIFSRKDVPYQNPLVVSTGIGQRSAITLPDGTKVTVNSMSEIAYRFDDTSGTRGVNIKGEAYFDVARDPEHPFIVTCDGISVECRGTEFDVKAYDDDDKISVVLNDGEVLVSDAVTSIAMRADMMVSYEKRRREFTSQRVYAEDYNDWMNGKMRFNDERLEDIVKVLARNYNVRLCILSPELCDERFTGSVGDGNLCDRLRVLTAAAEASYRLEGDSVGYIYKE